MSQESSGVAVCNTHTEAENIVREMQKAGFNLKKLSIVGRDYHTEEHVVGFYNAGDRMNYWGKLGAFWGGIWGLMFGSAFFLVPGLGPLVVAGPLVASIVGGLEGALVLGGLSALGAGLFSLGIPKDSVLAYETAIKSDKFLLIVHGSTEELSRARTLLKGLGHEMQQHNVAKIANS
jgi:hypothetical protein